ncbi:MULTISPECIES: 3-dehydroquinate synthase II [unclassified Pseudoalteromonas]|uniref:3-dehydroquinate synthase II n=1 Tax=unclassified Pseudoalteromonas TaxID=194690 RepID=UPI000F652DD5|nr:MULTISPECIES: 3-dehydroquinate synthase II [unclassified Pseudoalteromonas]RRS08743.1 3-dehydroquinate synthase [Pseudoalteromonas sp. J010]RXE97796.1 3-dehydroquinate synthase [Pseudoalteromonas sp. PS5]
MEATVKKDEQVTEQYETAENINRRNAIKLSNIGEGKNDKRAELNGPIIWFDTKNLKQQSPDDDMFARIINLQYSGIITYLNNIENLIKYIPNRMLVILKLSDKKELEQFKKSKLCKQFKEDKSKRLVVSYTDNQMILPLKEEGFSVCYHCYVDDNDSLHSSVYDGLKADYLSILFKDPTNIPLELVIASLQKTNTILMKQISSPRDVDDAIVTLGVMEYGAEGVIYSPEEHSYLDEFISRMEHREQDNLPIQVGTVKASYPVGMGYRACIDTGTLFDDDEGMLVGSTSQGGILCCPEVYFLPYMELRPFRVNAGAVHSYVYNTNDRTDYMSELKAGSNVMLVNSKGRVRTAPVGRVKIEKRPLRIIEVEFPNGEQVNVIMQDDWHVRIFSADAKPLNISELKAGDKVLGYTTEVGRHVGIKIDENIIEK